MQVPLARHMKGVPAMVAALLLAALASGGCTASMRPGDLSKIQASSDQPRAGNVYLLRGFIGIWSHGIDGMGEKINQSGVRANVYRCEQWREVTQAVIAKYKDQKEHEPLVLVGHSWGADHVLDLAHQLEAVNIPIDLIVTLDPVTPPDVPRNVKSCVNVFQTHGAWDAIPYFRGVALKAGEGCAPGSLQNMNIRVDRTDLLEPDTDHYNIEKNAKIHQEVIKQILRVCPPRPEWVRLHPQAGPSSTVGSRLSSSSSNPASGSKVSAVRGDTSTSH